MLFKKEENNEQEIKIVNQIRALGLDMIDGKTSLGLGYILSCAPLIYTLYGKHLNMNPDNNKYINKDRFVTFNEMSPLLYATLYMAGFPYDLEDIKNFGINKDDNLLKYNDELGIDSNNLNNNEVLSSALGFAIGEEYLSSLFKKENSDIINYYTYSLINDFDITNGSIYEAISLIGELKLNKMITFVLKTNIELNKSELNYNTDLSKLFTSNKWNTIEVQNGEDITGIDKAIKEAKESDKPTAIIIDITFGKYSKFENNKEIFNYVLNEEDLSEIKNKLNIRDVKFAVSNEIITDFQSEINNRVVNKFNDFVSKLEKINNQELIDIINQDTILNLSEITNDLEGKTLAYISNILINSVLASNFMSITTDIYQNNIYLNNKNDFTSKTKEGQNLHVFSRYSVLSNLVDSLSRLGIKSIVSSSIENSLNILKSKEDKSSIYLFTYNEETIKYIDYLKLFNNIDIYIPSDTNELIGSFKSIFQNNKGISVILIHNDDISIKNGTSINDVNMGAYILNKEEKTTFNILSSGKDLDIALELYERFKTKGIYSSVISIPCENIFNNQDIEYIISILNNNKSFYINNTKIGLTNKSIVNIYNKDIDTLEKNIESLI